MASRFTALDAASAAPARESADDEHRLGRRSRALHVGKYYPPFYGGMEQFLADLLPALRRRHIDCAAVVHDHRARLWGRPAKAAGHEHETNHRRTSDFDSSSLYRVPIVGRLAYAPVSPQFPMWLRRAVCIHRPHVVHVHLPNASAFWVLAVINSAKLPVVIHWHADVVASPGDHLLRMLIGPYRLLESALLRRAGRIICTSADYLQSSQPLARWHSKCTVVPLGIASTRIPKVDEKLTTEAEALWGSAGFRVLSIGRLTSYKGHEYLIRAMSQVPGARLIIVGGGDRLSMLQGVSEQCGVADRVLFTEMLPEGAKHALLETCDVLSLPSVERTEAFGMVLLEAMAHAKPVVASRIPGSGTGWVVEHGTSGLLVPPRNDDDIAAALTRLMNDREFGRRLGRNGLKRCERCFEIDRVAARVGSIYGEMAGHDKRSKIQG